MARTLAAVVVALAFFGACAEPPPARSESDAATERDTIVRDPIAAGRALALGLRCAGCHQEEDDTAGELSGRRATADNPGSCGPNLTPDPQTGLAEWDDFQLARALRDGVDRDGRPLCGTPRFDTLSDEDLASLVAYLRALPAVRRVVGVPRCDDAGAIVHPLDAGASDVDAADVDAATPSAGDAAIAADVVDDDSPPPCPATLTINEVQVAGSGGAGDEFVEIYNAGPCVASLAGASLQYVAATGSQPSVRWLGRLGDAISPGEFALIAGPAFAGGAVLGRLSGSSGSLAATGGGVALVLPDRGVVDSVGYGASATNAFVEARPADAPPAATSIARSPDGADTNDNRADFAVSAPTPGITNRVDDSGSSAGQRDGG